MTKRYAGERIGRLTLLYLQGKGDRWMCQCDCGISKSIAKGNLTGKSATKSCGCIRKEICKARERRKNHFKFARVQRYYKRNAKVRGLDWQLTQDEFARLISDECWYCGDGPSSHIPKRDHTGAYGIELFHNGIDRLDNSIGYLIDNTVSCCTICNRAKGSMTVQEFTDWIRRVSESLKDVMSSV
jgi:hypothetical protein